MLKKLLLQLIFLFSLAVPTMASDGRDLYTLMTIQLTGEWVLSPAQKQVGTKSYLHPGIASIFGTQKPGIVFSVIGRGTTIQEDLLPNSLKKMVTMYHCKDKECSTLKSTHYCVKKNQPEFIANLKDSDENRMIFDCDMSTDLCNSNDDHVHQIVHELTEDGDHLKSSYFSWKNGELKKEHSIYHFDKKE